MLAVSEQANRRTKTCTRISAFCGRRTRHGHRCEKAIWALFVDWPFTLFKHCLTCLEHLHDTMASNLIFLWQCCETVRRRDKQKRSSKVSWKQRVLLEFHLNYFSLLFTTFLLSTLFDSTLLSFFLLYPTFFYSLPFFLPLLHFFFKPHSTRFSILLYSALPHCTAGTCQLASRLLG